ncbi:hypothetical protein E1176_11595 [Fulvivirga sp. RKSG066]|uniref:OmpA family protein n=1 Tax=Fulvivirga aurantia TaxID=2529383 RepID=UPI0012BB9D70|nr:OmpA family protein [Fulvivirga aurantia]MTI21665.1 hypothetical protein [Fulvivirga aurantia]
MLSGRSLRIYTIGILLTMLLMASCSSNNRFRSKHSQNFFSYNYKGKLRTAKKQCDRLVKRKARKSKKKPTFFWQSTPKASSKSSSTALAEVDPNDTPPPKPKPQPKPKPAPAPEKTTEEKFEDLTIEEKHDIEDDVLKKNNIPPPSSEDHERIREEVADRIANENFPQELEPLYFLYDDDEFSVVDMEPFLIAVEYALQGRMLLIEGHTDASGGDSYNVQLSIQRVEKIRQLMLDMGVPDDRISVIGYGEEKADSTSKTKEEREMDRRVDFKVF